MEKTVGAADKSATATINLKKERKHLYNPSSEEVVIVNVPSMHFLMIDGEGDPNTAQAYKDAVATLYNLSYTLKFLVKKEQGVTYSVMPLEGLWWTKDQMEFHLDRHQETWRWTAMIMQPECVTENLFQRAVEQVKHKKEVSVPADVRFASFCEGRSVQIMHQGPYSAEGPTIAKLHTFIKDREYVAEGKHHEIYLSDPRRASPEKLRTVIRQPVRP